MAKNRMQLTAAQNDDRKLTGFAAEVYEWLEAMAFAIAIVVLIFTFFLRIITVTGPSMYPTFSDGNRVLVNRMMGEPEENDVVIIIMPVGDDYRKPLIKRIVATENQWLQIKDGMLYVGDTPDTLSARVISGLEEIRTPGDKFDWSEPVQVPEDCVFVMGDNRNDSKDSRSSAIGFVDEEYILGEVILRIFPFNDFGPIEKPNA